MTQILERVSRVVGLYRDGSGGHVVGPLKEKWIELIQKLAQFNYGRLTVVVQTDIMEGYDGYPGCELLIYPGNAEGNLGLMDELGRVIRERVPEAQANDFDRGNCLLIRTNYTDLKLLHEAIGAALENMAARHKSQGQ
jgi:hypothetical protein